MSEKQTVHMMVDDWGGFAAEHLTHPEQTWCDVLQTINTLQELGCEVVIVTKAELADILKYPISRMQSIFDAGNDLKELEPKMPKEEFLPKDTRESKMNQQWRVEREARLAKNNIKRR